jgi:hypothetical protein
MEDARRGNPAFAHEFSREFEIQPDWIVHRPTMVKPMHETGKGQSGRYIERERDKSNYSLADIEHIADILAENHAALSSYLQGVGLIGGRDPPLRSAI